MHHNNIDRDRFYAAITFLFMHLLVSSVHAARSMDVKLSCPIKQFLFLLKSVYVYLMRVFRC